MIGNLKPVIVSVPEEPGTRCSTGFMQLKKSIKDGMNSVLDF